MLPSDLHWCRCHTMCHPPTDKASSWAPGPPRLCINTGAHAKCSIDLQRIVVFVLPFGIGILGWLQISVKMESYAAGVKFDCLLFDMDDTLYPLSLGINLACRKNIEDYMLNKLQIEESQVPKMCLDLYREYGTTMAGLKVLGYDFDYDDFHACVHGTLPYEKLKPDPVLRQLLLSFPQRKIVRIICFETLNPPTEQDANDQNQKNAAEAVTDGGSREGSNDPAPLRKGILCKPSLESMEAVIEIAKLDAKRTVFFDDSPRNIAAGKAAGFHTVVVGTSALVPGADMALESIHNIKEALPELWDAAGEHVEAVLRPAAVETTVLA
ncbi:unnamed protein product [Urochloa decumbens]|uniref:Uncharacterized protein n=1 Tax=Urochloa decumbens TaxID=240449 RepID=A0ABC9G3V5_9POAL